MSTLDQLFQSNMFKPKSNVTLLCHSTQNQCSQSNVLPPYSGWSKNVTGSLREKQSILSKIQPWKPERTFPMEKRPKSNNIQFDALVQNIHFSRSFHCSALEKIISRFLSMTGPKTAIVSSTVFNVTCRTDEFRSLLKIMNFYMIRIFDWC